MKITANARPFLLTMSGHTYPINAEEAQRLLDEYPAERAAVNRVVLRGGGSNRATLQPATLGGGPAFVIEK